jgi:hypothetical protein
MGATNQDLKNRTARGHQPAPSEHVSRNNTLASAAWAEGIKHARYDNLCAAAGTIFQPFALETMGATALRRKRSTTSSPSIYATRVCRGGTEAQAQEGHLVRPAPGNECPGYHSTRRRPARRRGGACTRESTIKHTFSGCSQSEQSSPLTRWAWHGKKPVRSPSYCVASQNAPFPYYADKPLSSLDFYTKLRRHHRIHPPLTIYTDKLLPPLLLPPPPLLLLPKWQVYVASYAIVFHIIQRPTNPMSEYDRDS